ncbi:hypothetical protein PhCBS80983_g00622 [Powellomyces hirtus]|uniref:Uncharacterized protein n=1 Tax=Powellomyces hirtus TaxID=109895 RepID=A0A507EDE4_9FUNG|nr:S1/P1 nuclease-domain-containing protein [Powellomyces hirtus]TPX62143.1 hypothetical protein PhCBS80983_g00622 [Powellomyces hirtus]
MHAKLSILSSIAVLASSAAAWGIEGHSAVGHIADNLISPETKAVVDYLLPAGWNFNRSSTWADEIKGGATREKYAWASVLHYIDAEDVTPLDANATHPVECEIVFPRDSHGGMNIVDGIGNYTVRLVDPKQDWEQKSEALKFLSHFVGDVTQPLHTCAKLIGGNKFFATWENATQYIYNGRVSYFQLHVIWDVYIPQKDMNENFGGSLDAYKKWILDAVQPGGVWATEASSWIATDKPGFEWAKDTNDLNCGIVWDKDLLAGNGTATENDLAGEYYQKTYMEVRKQIAKGGYRFAKFLDDVLKGQPAGPVSSTAAATSTVAGGETTIPGSETTAAPGYPTGGPAPTDGPITSTIEVIVTPTNVPSTSQTKVVKPTGSPDTDTPVSAAVGLKSGVAAMFALAIGAVAFL